MIIVIGNNQSQEVMMINDLNSIGRIASALTRKGIPEVLYYLSMENPDPLPDHNKMMWWPVSLLRKQIHFSEDNRRTLDHNLRLLQKMGMVEIDKAGDLTYWYDTYETYSQAISMRLAPPKEQSFKDKEINMVRLAEKEL